MRALAATSRRGCIIWQWLRTVMDTVVQKLSSLQRPALLEHLQTLSPEDRRLRFGTYMNSWALEEYVNHIDFAHDMVFGIYGREMTLIGMAHLALDRDHHYAELGLSVEPAQRGKGYGLALLNRGKLSAVTRGYTTLFMHCLSENRIMIHLARKSGLKLVTEQGEVDAHIQLEATSHAAVAREALEDQIALADFLFKQQFQWLFKHTAAA
jgi:RimJ/RimL family protein N-acetyltransferase